MLITWKQVCGSWVIARDGMLVGRVRDVVVDPETGEIPALWVGTADGMQLLSINEIQRWTRDEIFVESFADLVSAEEFPRLEHVLQSEVKIIHALVFEQLQQPVKIGKCHNFAFDTLSPKLVSIEVVSGWFLWQKTRVIHRRQILEIKIDGIYVSPPVISEEIEVSSATDILGNSLPEPETSQTFRVR
jgi:sporulation protein YlmC with PRC-barrel domain